MSKKTVICHFYNEEYLLHWWLKYHRMVFDHGIMINYASTDRSVEVIKSLCPSWEIVDSRNENFEAHLVDEEVVEIERRITGWKCCLNVTEFLLGDFDSLQDTENTQHLIPVFQMIDDMLYRVLDPNEQIFYQLYNGLPIDRSVSIHKWRSLHNYNVEYKVVGRHFEASLPTSCKFIILKYVFSPMNEELIKRKLQIQTRMTWFDISLDRGFQHSDHGQGLTKEKILKEYENCKPMLINLKDIIHKFDPLLANQG